MGFVVDPFDAPAAADDPVLHLPEFLLGQFPVVPPDLLPVVGVNEVHELCFAFGERPARYPIQGFGGGVDGQDGAVRRREGDDHIVHGVKYALQSVLDPLQFNACPAPFRDVGDGGQD
jgi:hypothetical protein